MIKAIDLINRAHNDIKTNQIFDIPKLLTTIEYDELKIQKRLGPISSGFFAIVSKSYKIKDIEILNKDPKNKRQRYLKK